MIALVDVNNFYASCERMFNPALNGKPIIVLSNNDGCAIARSDEAKALGIQMGAPAFLIHEMCKKNDVKVLSSNYTLYGSMSERVMHILRSFVPTIEVYSIDEAFLNLEGFKNMDLSDLAKRIRDTVMSHTGLPVSIGIGATKALAKMANRFAKKHHKASGVHVADTSERIQEMLAKTSIGDVWGIGHQYQKLLLTHHVTVAADFVKLPEEWIRKNMSVVGQRLYNELKGTSCFTWEEIRPSKKNICTARSFGNIITNLSDLQQAIAAHTSSCARKLRQDNSCASKVHVFIETNPHRGEDQQYFTGVTIPLNVASNNTNELIKFALWGLKKIFKPGYKYQRGGVMVLDLVPQQHIQLGLFDTKDRQKDHRLSKALDSANQLFGKDVVRFGTQSYGKKWHLKAAQLSPKYTTQMSQIMTVNSS